LIKSKSIYQTPQVSHLFLRNINLKKIQTQSMVSQE